MGNLFNPDSWFWKPFGYIADVLLLSCIWFLCSVPLFTLGASTTALYDAAAHCIRGQDKRLFSRFFRTFQKEFKLSTLSWLLWAAVIALCYLALRAYSSAAAPTDGAVVITVAALALLVVIVGVVCWVFPLLSRFTFGFAQLNTTAVKLALSRPLRTIALGICTVFAGYLCLQFWLPFLFLPALLILLWTVLIEPVFRSYMNP